MKKKEDTITAIYKTCWDTKAFERELEAEKYRQTSQDKATEIKEKGVKF